MSAVSILPLEGIPSVQPGDDLARLLAEAIRSAGGLEPRDIVVVCQKIVSKAEGRVARLSEVEAGDKAKAAELFKTAQCTIDSIADKGIFHKNKAARDKSRLSAKVKALAIAA